MWIFFVQNRMKMSRICHTTLAWAKARSIRIEFIQPGNPQQNAYVERYNRTVRYEWLSQYLFDRLEEVQDFATQWLWQYNHERPNMALGGITPKQNWPWQHNLYFWLMLKMGGGLWEPK